MGCRRGLRVDWIRQGPPTEPQFQPTYQMLHELRQEAVGPHLPGAGLDEEGRAAPGATVMFPTRFWSLDSGRESSPR